MITPGSRLGPYEILSALGAGGMGEVARDTRLEEHVGKHPAHEWIQHSMVLDRKRPSADTRQHSRRR